MGSASQLHLLDYLAMRLGCDCLSDLHFLQGSRKVRLKEELLAIPPGAADPSEWKDTFHYLTGDQSGSVPEAIKVQLIARLSEEMEECM